MNTKKMLIVLTLLVWISWVQLKKAYISVRKNLKDDSAYELKIIQNKILKKQNRNIDNIKGFTLINNILDTQIQNKVFSYLKKEKKLTSLKRDFKKNLQKRKRIHWDLLSRINTEPQSKEYISLITDNWLKIDKISKLRNIFFNGKNI